MSAVSRKGNLQVCGINLIIKLKTEDWLKYVEREISLCTTNCAPLCEYIDISTNDDYNCVGIPTMSDNLKVKPPSRPPLPKSPQVTPKHQKHTVRQSSVYIKHNVRVFDALHHTLISLNITTP